MSCLISQYSYLTWKLCEIIMSLSALGKAPNRPRLLPPTSPTCTDSLHNMSESWDHTISVWRKCVYKNNKKGTKSAEKCILSVAQILRGPVLKYVYLMSQIVTLQLTLSILAVSIEPLLIHLTLVTQFSWPSNTLSTLKLRIVFVKMSGKMVWFSLL